MVDDAELPFNPDSLARMIVAERKTSPELLTFAHLGAWGLSHLTSSLTVDGKPRLVGRELESVRLLHAIDSVIREDIAVVTTVAGVPGSGKTRLIEDTLYVAEAAGFENRIFSVAAQPGDAPNATIARLLTARFGLQNKSAAFKRECLLRRVGELFEDARVEDVCYFLGGLVGAKFEQTPLTRALSQQSFHAELALQTLICELFAADSQRAPLCLVIENLHHIDRESLGTLIALTDELRPGTLMICSGHPDFFARTEHFGETGVALHEHIELAPLEPDDVRALLRQAVGPCVSGAADFERYVLDSGLGNPGLIQELIRELWAFGALQAASGADGCEFLPSRLPDLESVPRIKVAKEVRLSSLPQLETAMLEAAAVVGSVFWAGMWNALLPLVSSDIADVDPEASARCLAALERDGHLLRLPDSRIQGEVELVFKDAEERERLVQQVPASRRRALHRAIADWLSQHELELGQSSDLSVLLARHLSQSGSSYRASTAYLRAARSAQAERSGLKAATYFEQALEALGEQDNALRVDVLFEYGSLLGDAGHPSEARQVFVEMAELGKRLELPSKRGLALHRLGRIHRQQGELLLAQRALERALRAFESARDAAGVAATKDDLGMVLWLLGDRTRAVPFLRSALHEHQGLSDEQGMAVSLSRLAIAWSEQGHGPASERALGIADEICVRHADMSAKAEMLLTRAELATRRHDLEGARELCRSATEQAFGAKNKPLLLRSLIQLGMAELRCKDLGRGEELLRRGVQLAEETGCLLELSEARRGLAKLALSRGQHQEARRYIASALRIARQLKVPQQLAPTLRTTAEVLAQTGGGPAETRVVRYFMRGIELSKQLGSEHELAKGYRAFSRFAGGFENEQIRRQGELLRALSDEIFRRLELPAVA